MYLCLYGKCVSIACPLGSFIARFYVSLFVVYVDEVVVVTIENVEKRSTIGEKFKVCVHFNENYNNRR